MASPPTRIRGSIREREGGGRTIRTLRRFVSEGEKDLSGPASFRIPSQVCTLGRTKALSKRVKERAAKNGKKKKILKS